MPPNAIPWRPVIRHTLASMEHHNMFIILKVCWAQGNIVYNSTRYMRSYLIEVRRRVPGDAVPLFRSPNMRVIDTVQVVILQRVGTISNDNSQQK